MYDVPVRPGQSWWQVRLRRQVAELFRLAGPIIVSRVGVLLIVLADTVMVGRFSTAELAYLSIGTTPVIPLLLTGMGLLMGTLVFVANAVGAGDLSACGAIWRRSLPYAVILGVAGAAICSLGEGLLLLLGQSPDIARGGGEVLQIMGLGLPAVLLFIATNFFLEGLKRPVPAMVLMALANVLNVGLNWLLIYGVFDLPALGAVGAAWATTIVRFLLAAGILVYVWWLLPERERYRLRERPTGGWQSWAAQRRIGYASGLAIGMEAGAFSAMSVFAGWLGPEALAAYTIAFNLLAILFMIAIGLGAATAVRVGIAYGRGDTRDMALAGWTGLIVNTAVAVVLCLILVAAADVFVGFYTSDSALAGVAEGLVILIAFVLIVDGGQSVMSNALRGRRDVWVPTGFQAVSYLGVMIPLGWLLAFDFGRGAAGLVEAVMFASVIAVSLLSIRFAWLSSARKKTTKSLRNRIGS